MTVQQIIDRLPDSHALKPFWNGVAKNIRSRRYDWAMEMLQPHCYDYDYNDQIIAVCNSIIEHVQTLKE